MECSAFPGNRVEPQRAGMMPTALLIFLQDNFRRVRNVARNPVRPAIIFPSAETGLDEDGPNAGVSAATDVARFVANEKRSLQIEAMLALRFENHAGARLSPDRRRCRQIRAMIAGVDQTISDLAAELQFDRAVIILSEIAAPDSALIGNDHELVTFFL